MSNREPECKLCIVYDELVPFGPEEWENFKAARLPEDTKHFSFRSTEVGSGDWFSKYLPEVTKDG